MEDAAMAAPVIDIFSDPICPWCMIGKRRLDRALQMAASSHSFCRPGIRWRVFQLNPTMPPKGMDRTAYLNAKFGGAVRAAEVYRNIRKEGAAEDIDFAFDRITRTPNTLKAHALIRIASSQGLADAMVQRLFDAYFLEGLDIGDPSVLADLAAEVGLNEDMAGMFNDADLAARLRAEDAEARGSGISGVPYFVIGGRYALAGAVPPEALIRALELAVQTEA